MISLLVMQLPILLLQGNPFRLPCAHVCLLMPRREGSAFSSRGKPNLLLINGRLGRNNSNTQRNARAYSTPYRPVGRGAALGGALELIYNPRGGVMLRATIPVARLCAMTELYTD
jgi:hypothetical protein